MLEYKRKDQETIEFVLDGEALITLKGQQQIAILYDKIPKGTEESNTILQCHGEFWPVYERFQRTLSVLKNTGQEEIVKSLAMWHIAIKDIDDNLLHKINEGINGARLFDGEEWKKNSYITHSNQVETILTEN